MKKDPYEFLERALGRPLFAPVPDRDASEEEWNDFYRKDKDACEIILAISKISRKLGKRPEGGE